MREAHDRARPKDPYTPPKSTPFERLSLGRLTLAIFGRVSIANDDIEATYVPASKAVAVCFGRYQVPRVLSSHPVELIDHPLTPASPASLLRIYKSLQSTKKMTNLLDGTSRDWYGLRVVCVGIFVASN